MTDALQKEQKDTETRCRIKLLKSATVLLVMKLNLFLSAVHGALSAPVGLCVAPGIVASSSTTAVNNHLYQ